MDSDGDVDNALITSTHLRTFSNGYILDKCMFRNEKAKKLIHNRTADNRTS